MKTMYLAKHNPARHLRDGFLTRSLFEDFFGAVAGQGLSEGFFQPRTDILEKEKSYELQLALPGMKKEEIKIDLKGDTLVISGERKKQQLEEKEKFHMVETHYGSFSRSFQLPENLQKDGIAARFEDGVLFVELPKAESTKPTSIEIK